MPYRFEAIVSTGVAPPAPGIGDYTEIDKSPIPGKEVTMIVA